jgi:hypothetical protein
VIRIHRPRLHRPVRGLIAAFLAVAMSYPGIARAFDPDRDSLSPDFIARFDCTNDLLPPDQFWEHLLADLGFRPLNPPALAKKYGVYYPVGGQNILGIDSEDRILNVSGAVSPHGDVSIILQSPPPTIHDIQLETKLRSVVEQTKCEVRAVRTYDNKQQALPLFRNILETTKGWYAQADAMANH